MKLLGRTLRREVKWRGYFTRAYWRSMRAAITRANDSIRRGESWREAAVRESDRAIIELPEDLRR